MQSVATDTLTHAQVLAGTAAASTAGGIAASSAWEAVGIGPMVLFMALTGTALGLLFEPPGGGRGRLFALALVYTVVSAALAVLMAELSGLDGLAGVIALLLAFSGSTVVPALREAAKQRVKRVVGGGAADDEHRGRIDDGFRHARKRRPPDDDDTGFSGTWKGD